MGDQLAGEWLRPAHGGGLGKWQGCGLPDCTTHRALLGTDGVIPRGRVAHEAHKYRLDPCGHADWGKGAGGAGVGQMFGVRKGASEGVGQAVGAEGGKKGGGAKVCADLQPPDCARWRWRRQRNPETW